MQNYIKSLSTNIVLIGFMGSGKSSIARELHRLSGAFILDSDEIISFNENLSIPQIFSEFSEEYFRELESKFCAFIKSCVNGAIISTGGGMPLFCDVKPLGIVFFLDASFETILSRLDENELNKRPLFKDKDSAFKLYKKRLEFYKRSAHFCIDANRDKEIIAKEILQKL
ncbi:MAG: shikimate kinase [Helicobacter sp.]|nr:shikimate kinase [Helicobacteraceae bacterium]MDY3114161.1 shikimate kinase [Helicobacter sp.]